MKKIVLILLIATTMINCSKNEPAENFLATKSKNTFEGEWNWQESQGGIAGIIETPASTGKIKTIKISESDIKEYTNGVLSNTKNFTIGSNYSIHAAGLRPMFIFSGIPNKSFEIIGNQLILKDECYDCFNSTYEKIN